MSIQHRKLKKSFGRYKAVDVNACIKELELAVEAREERIASLGREIDGVRHELQNSLDLQQTAEHERAEMQVQMAEQTAEMATQAKATERKLADEIEALKKQLADQAAEMDKKLADATEARNAAEESLAVLRKQNETLTVQSRKMGRKQRADAETIRDLREQLERANQDLDGLRDELSASRYQTEFLGQRVANQKSAIESIEQMMRGDQIGEASAKAQQILQEAVLTRQKMLEDAEEIRAQALASVRAAYFNTMGFRQEIEERFVNLQHDLDQSMGSLRTLQMADPSVPGMMPGGKSE